ncbi:MAG: hypothetical protein KDD44_06085, partial [Bdellovibrionales bacterium]|nr:hypothetical protein [Bdellovibrionales bacterium]
MTSSASLLRCLSFLLRPVIRFALNRSLKLQDVIEAAKIVFLEVAEEMLDENDIERSASKLSAMTGVHRRDISRIRDKDLAFTHQPHLVGKVIGAWQHAAGYQTGSGAPRTLACEGAQSEFAELVATVSQDVSPYAILFELERCGLVARTTRGVRLQSGVYVPKSNQAAGYSILSNDIEDLISAVDHNTTDDHATPHL